MAVAIVVGLDLLGGLGRDRPFVVLGLTPLLPHAPDASFPSDHTLVAAAIAWPLLIRRRPAGFCCLIAALLVGGARVAAGLHFPSDVLGSTLMAVVPAVVGLALEPAISRSRALRWATG